MKLSFFYVFDETFFFDVLSKLYFIFFGKTFIWRTSFGETSFGELHLAKIWRRLAMPIYSLAAGLTLAMPVVLIFFSNGWTNKQTYTHMLNYIIDKISIHKLDHLPTTTVK